MSSAAVATTEEYTGPAFDAHDKQYLLVALGLGILTAIEVVLSYTSLKHAALALPLLTLAAVKFIVVAGFFMHLKIDTPLFRRLFIMGAVLAGFCYMCVMYLFKVVSGPVPWLIYVAFAVGLLSVWVFRGFGGGDHGHAPDDHDHADHDHGHAHAGHDHAH